MSESHLRHRKVTNHNRGLKITIDLHKLIILPLAKLIHQQLVGSLKKMDLLIERLVMRLCRSESFRCVITADEFRRI
ncbi:hypothetical protein P8452_56823 [Trifolium repens]|nr:hypothetical protein P8452_56823 [Trifolium repens]WJX72996.1 hypothetical protein P8452_56823 [Trifolium repens]